MQSSNQILQFALFVKQHLHRKGCLHFLKITEQSVTYFKILYIIKKNSRWKLWMLQLICLTLYILTSVCIFSILFSIHFLRCWQGEFVWQSRASLLGDHLPHSHDLHAWSRGDSLRRNYMFITLNTPKCMYERFLRIISPCGILNIKN